MGSSFTKRRIAVIGQYHMVVGEEIANMLIDQRKEQLRLSVAKKGRTSKMKAKTGKKEKSHGGKK